MQEEIKEILDKCTPFLFGDEVDKLYNYITNLQEYETIIEMEFKREYAKRYLEERRKEQPHLLYPDSDEIYKRYYELKEENTKLKELCDKYEEEHSTTFEEWKKDINIIDELEKDINNQLTMTRKLDKYNEGFFNATLHYYNKLNELKGDNK